MQFRSVGFALALMTLSCSQAPELAPEIFQHREPIDQISMYFTGFHPMKDEPHHALTAHHFCSTLNEDFTQCVLFDGPGKNAKMNGIEYVISERAFDKLPKEEKKYWHPHNFEIMSGQLAMPDMPESLEHDAMKELVNSYGKTWHLWNTGGHDMPADALPLGTPKLAWSYNAEGEAPEELITNRDRSLHVSTEQKRRDREDLRPLLHCQEGVDALAEAFPERKPLAGICEKK